MCGVSLSTRKSSVVLLERLSVFGVAEVVRRGRLWWYGHLQHKDESDWVSKSRILGVDGQKCRGKSRKTWMQCVEEDMKLVKLCGDDAQDRVDCRIEIRGDRQTRASTEKQKLKRWWWCNCMAPFLFLRGFDGQNKSETGNKQFFV